MPAAVRQDLVQGPWDLFCRVVDNHGDLGVCWRLARALAAGGTAVRLWVDDASALAWMAPHIPAGIQVLAWADPPPGLAPGPVVVEAFGAEPPAAFVARMAQAKAQCPARAPLWVNLEYLSAEPYATRSHRLPSPQWSGPGQGLTRWFFYPGFTPDTGGLLHGDGATADEGAASPTADSAATTPAIAPSVAPSDPPSEPQPVLVFAYPHLPWPQLLDALARWPGSTRLLLPPGGAQPALAALTAGLPQPEQPRPGVRWQAIAARPQTGFDALLAGCALVIVRGEDSFARANLASDAPFLWHIYRQDDGAHSAKLQAFLQLYLADAPAALAGPLRALFLALNDLGPWPSGTPDTDHAASPWPDLAAWRRHQARWRRQLLAQPSLLVRLRAFVTQLAAAQAGAAPGGGGADTKAQ